MRISRLDLIRYGKFTDKPVSLPKSDRDFHLIVGPNEAGKSTLRNAIQDLLFGIETRSRYNFIHPHSEMCLGALIEQDESQLDFIRTKARTKTLQSAAGTPLPDNALVPFLGQIDRPFFDQMFGLNHERLVTGGQEILSASNDIGQILFQAAAGIGSLGEVRDRLEAEAGKLWAKRKSSDREYYIASGELDQAEAALKQATVRTKDWQEARSLVDKIGDSLKQAQEQYRALEQERIQLERARRVAPMLTTLVELERQVAELGKVIQLPENAAGILEKSEHEIAVASQSLEIFDEQAKELERKAEGLHPDRVLLARAEDVEALAEMRLQLSNHEGDILKREEEIRVFWQNVQDSMRQLGWPEENEQGVSKRLPGSLIRSAIDNLLRRKEALDQTLLTAEEAFRSRGAEVAGFDAEIAVLPATEVPVALVDALTMARSMGDVADQQQRIKLQVERLQRQVATTVLELGERNPGLDALRKLLPPTLDETNALIKQRNELDAVVSKIKDRITEINSEIQTLELEISQYKAVHHPVTLADVQKARKSRDSSWQAIKTGKASLQEVAPGYEKAVADSDIISDKRHDKAQEETELQSRLDRLERLQQQKAEQESRLLENIQSLNAFDEKWADRMSAAGLAGMSLLHVNDWRSVKERVLNAADALAEAQVSQQDFESRVAQAATSLKTSLLPIQPEAKDMALSALTLLADEVINTTTRAQERRSALTTQRIRAEASLPDLKARVAQARTALNTWQDDLQKNLVLAHLPVDADIGMIEGALVLFATMDQHLNKIRDIRVNRIDMMRRDLKDFADTAKSLAAAIASNLANESSAQIALTLAAQLKQELASSDELERLENSLETVIQQANATRNRIAEATASLEPLLRISSTMDNDGLRAAIENSDRHRLLSMEVDQILKQLLQAGDGLDRSALETQLAAIDINMTASRLSEINLQVADVVSEQNRLSGELNSAEATLGKIAGQDDAARAESLRQEALARMANAAERYVKVCAAAKLLRWAIERFRESKQGPMLMRASEVFSGLTQGLFTRLAVDYESEPLKLSGQRSTGEFVDIEGMSEGTRDQLFLALRLAALELHLEQTAPLPLIADDLFINYDDGRAKAGLEALAKLSKMTQVIFLTHHEHLVPVAHSVLGERINVVRLG